MTTKRMKPGNIIPLRTDKAVDEMLCKIAQIKTQLKRIDTDAEEKINIIREKAKTEAVSLLEHIETMGNSIFAYAEYNQHRLFDKKKTVEMIFGSIGYRQSTKLSITKKTLDTLKEMDLYDCIKIRESVNKDVLSMKSAEIIKQVGAKKVIENKFWYEVKEENLTNTTGKVKA